MTKAASAIHRLQGTVQHYSWGGKKYIPALLGIDNDDHQPFAEYWLGAHPNHSSILKLGEDAMPLQQYIAQDPVTVLGEPVATRFGSLPYLLKVLDVAQMLSIQVHPDKASAAINFERETAAGIPTTAAHRNYKDANHKPELMVALSDFWLLHGFKTPQLLLETVEQIPDLLFLADIFREKGYEGLYNEVMTLPQTEVNRVLQPMIERLVPLYHNDELKKIRPDFWAARAAGTYCKEGNYDRGIFSIYLFNLVHLKRGEGIYQPAGLPHAYLEGQNVEIMANSDNVLRAGLTDKHIDVAELMKYVQFTETIPRILGTDAYSREVYFETPAEEFELTQYTTEAAAGFTYTTYSADILLVLDGAMEVQAEKDTLKITKGEAVFINSHTPVSVKLSQQTTIFRAAVPKSGKTNR